MAEFVPPDFDVPHGLETSELVLEPLGPEHNEQDYDAWTSSMEHIAATPGFPWGSWPREMTPDKNRADLQRHADDFRTRKGFTYTVLDPSDRDVIGCVYIYPLPDSRSGASARSWVRKSHAHLDTPLWHAVSEWLESDWPFATVEYAPPGLGSLDAERASNRVWKYARVMTDPLKPQDNGMRDVGSGLIRSGDQAMLVRELGRGIGWLLLAGVRSIRWLHDRLVRSRGQAR